MSRTRTSRPFRAPRLLASAWLVASAFAPAACGAGALSMPDGSNAPVAAPRPKALDALDAPDAPDAPDAVETADPAEVTAPELVTLPALERPERFVDLAVSGHRAALVALPLGATTPRPVVVAAHGALGHTRPYCELWQRLVAERAFVVCPRGARMTPALPDDVGGHFYPAHPALADEVTRALEALAHEFGAHVDLRAPVYVGFSQGANMGALILPTHPAHFARALLVEGGVGEHQEWNLAVAERLRAEGAVAVELVCGRYACARAAERTAALLRRGGLASEAVYVSDGGHHFDGAMARALADAFARLVGGDARFVAGPGSGG